MPRFDFKLHCLDNSRREISSSNGIQQCLDRRQCKTHLRRGRVRRELRRKHIDFLLQWLPWLRRTVRNIFHFQTNPFCPMSIILHFLILCVYQFLFPRESWGDGKESWVCSQKPSQSASQPVASADVFNGRHANFRMLRDVRIQMKGIRRKRNKRKMGKTFQRPESWHLNVFEVSFSQFPNLNMVVRYNSIGFNWPVWAFCKLLHTQTLHTQCTCVVSSWGNYAKIPRRS